VTPRADYDIAILGGGLAGLSLAVRLADPQLAHLRVLLVEARTDYRRDRTWSYWALRPHPFKDAVAVCWSRWAVQSDEACVVRSAPGLHYETIPADALYGIALDRIRRAPNINLRLGTHVAADVAEDEDGVTVALDGCTLRVGLAFDTRPPPDIGRHGLVQRFLGQEVETNKPVFDPGTATLMDFRCGQHGAAHFTYVLPYTPCRALVEDTWFSPRGFQVPDGRAAIRAYMERRHGIPDFAVRFEEQGALPMDPRFQPRPGVRLLPLGTAGGASRPSTGYAFLSVQAECDRIAADLASGRLPTAPRRRSGLVRMMDHVLLDLLETRPEQAPSVFAALFARCSPRRLLRFLNDAARPPDFLAVMASMPIAPAALTAVRLGAVEMGKRLPSALTRHVLRRPGVTTAAKP